MRGTYDQDRLLGRFLRFGNGKTRIFTGAGFAFLNNQPNRRRTWNEN